MEGRFLSNEVSDNFIELIDCFNLQCIDFALSFARSLISGVDGLGFTLLSEGWCIVAHVSEIYIDTLEHC